MAKRRDRQTHSSILLILTWMIEREMQLTHRFHHAAPHLPSATTHRYCSAMYNAIAANALSLVKSYFFLRGQDRHHRIYNQLQSRKSTHIAASENSQGYLPFPPDYTVA